MCFVTLTKSIFSSASGASGIYSRRMVQSTGVCENTRPMSCSSRGASIHSTSIHFRRADAMARWRPGIARNHTEQRAPADDLPRKARTRFVSEATHQTNLERSARHLERCGTVKKSSTYSPRNPSQLHTLRNKYCAMIIKNKLMWNTHKRALKQM